jgi:serine/threonine protein kinase
LTKSSAPEVLKLEGYSQAIDFWSIGIIQYLLLGGCLPFQGKTQTEIIEQTLKCQLVFPEERFKNVSEQAMHLISGLLRRNPETRLKGAGVLDHPWFDEIRSEMSPVIPMIYDKVTGGVRSAAASSTPLGLSTTRPGTAFTFNMFRESSKPILEEEASGLE